MTPSDHLRRAADVLDSHVVSDRQAQIIELMALQIMRLDCSPNAVREAELLREMLGYGCNSWRITKPDAQIEGGWRNGSE